MQFLCGATHAAFPQPGHHRAACFANVYRQLPLVQCRCLSPLLTAAAGLHTARTGSGGDQGRAAALPRDSALGMRNAGAAAGFFESGNVLCLVVRCLLLLGSVGLSSSAEFLVALCPEPRFS
jgi:hypothetical protein